MHAGEVGFVLFICIGVIIFLLLANWAILHQIFTKLDESLDRYIKFLERK